MSGRCVDRSTMCGSNIVSATCPFASECRPIGRILCAPCSVSRESTEATGILTRGGRPRGSGGSPFGSMQSIGVNWVAFRREVATRWAGVGGEGRQFQRFSSYGLQLSCILSSLIMRSPLAPAPSELWKASPYGNIWIWNHVRARGFPRGFSEPSLRVGLSAMLRFSESNHKNL